MMLLPCRRAKGLEQGQGQDESQEQEQSHYVPVYTDLKVQGGEELEVVWTVWTPGDTAGVWIVWTPRDTA